MFRFVFLIIIAVIILLILNYRSKVKGYKTNFYKTFMLVLIVLSIIILFATSGKFIIPQILQLLKIGLPFLTKFIGL